MAPNIFKQSIVVDKSNIVHNHHVNNLVYLKWAQDIGGAHWSAVIDGTDIEDCIWVVGRQEIDYLAELKENDTIELETYISEVNKHKSTRIINFYRDEALVAKAIIVWVCINKNTKKPMRISAAAQALFLDK